MTEKMKKLMDELILELDSHAPIEKYSDKYHEYFFDTYIKPCIDEYNNKDAKDKNDDWMMRNGEVI